ncbi:MAG: SpoIIE family protein phosphatase [candidate division Zixibacteria bacterium]
MGQLISLVYLVSGLTLVVLAWMIFRENPKNRLNRIAAMMLSLAGLAAAVTALYRSVIIGATELPQWLENCFLMWELFFPAFLYFSATFPEPQQFYNNHKKIFQLAFLPHILHLVMLVLLADPNAALEMLNFESSIPVLGAILNIVLSLLKIVTAFLGFLLLFHARFFSIVNLIYVVFALILLYTSYRKIENPRLKQQVRVIIYGIGLGVGLYSVGFIIPNIFALLISEQTRYAVVMLGLIVGPGSIAWAIVRYQFLDIGLIARRSLVYTITTAIVVGGYLLIVMQVGSLAQELLGSDSEILNVAIIIIMLLFFQPIYTQVDDFIKRIFIRSRGDYSRLVESFSREILTVFHSDKLAVTVADTLKREMFIEAVEVCFEGDERSFRLATAKGTSESVEIEDSIYQYLLLKKAPVFSSELPGDIDSECIGGSMTDTGVEVVVPLVHQEKVAGLILLSGKVAGFRYNSEDMTFLSFMANQIAVAMENVKLYHESMEKQRLEEELAVAKQIQVGLLPRQLPTFDNFEFAAFIEPSRQVGGDFYDFIPISDGKIGIVIADASGKGVPAALLIARMQAIMQSEARLGREVGEMMSSVNRFIVESTSQDKFATCFYLEIDDIRRRLRYCNAGHNYPILIRRDGSVENLIKGGLLLGAFADVSYETGTCAMGPGDTLVLYTDGVTEAMDANEVEYGEDKLIADLLELKAFPAEIICSKTIKNIKQYAAGIDDKDDITLVVIKATEKNHG